MHACGKHACILELCTQMHAYENHAHLESMNAFKNCAHICLHLKIVYAFNNFACICMYVRIVHDAARVVSWQNTARSPPEFECSMGWAWIFKCLMHSFVECENHTHLVNTNAF
jgi:hypothetical protein